MERQRIGTLNPPLRRVRHVARSGTSAWPRTTGIVLLLAGFIAGLCLLYLWQGTAILALTAQRESIKATLSSTEEMNHWLEFRIDQAFSLARVSRIAQEQLHMVEPADIKYVPIPMTKNSD